MSDWIDLSVSKPPEGERVHVLREVVDCVYGNGNCQDAYGSYRTVVSVETAPLATDWASLRVSKPTHWLPLSAGVPENSERKGEGIPSWFVPLGNDHDIYEAYPDLKR